LKLLLDGHTLYWLVFKPEQLAKRTADALDDAQNELFISRATLWEMSAKMSRGGLPIPGNSIRYLLQQIELLGITILLIEMTDILRTETLPLIHLDPFDRILVAQALERGLTILTKDKDMHQYDVPCIWK
jgi:PIN domain nuclease of toxin-antitoxin system